MKHTLTIIGFLCLAVGTAQAQMWFSEGSSWVAQSDSWGGHTNSIIKIVGDTMIGSKTMYKSYVQGLYVSYPQVAGDDFDTSYYYGPGAYYWEQNDSVFVWSGGGNTPVLWYDFTAVAGDSTHIGENWDGEPMYMYLDSVSTVFMVGKERRLQHWHFGNLDTNMCVSIRVAILEGLGMISHEITDAFSPEPSLYFGGPRHSGELISQYCIIDGGGSNVYCYHDGSVAADTSAWGSPCQDTIISNVPQPILLSGMTITPNPATVTTMIQWQQPVSGVLTVADFSGREVARYRLQNTTSHTLDCAAWPQGVYVVRLQAEGGKQHISKLIIQH